ncbi:hypothetical protein HOF56_00420 [Candidatus Peribacteria bacterium]|jgi:hypothetical protein|nr:hypothetical protein [Candidatus Peribacteria bacterium]MBT4021598.1 hypothetical protein [Candidatus Peribacteria bacterium]MBT4240507.1 hypothetical protein [Candidatus Peribacteria bacterium]MBT4474312.1 hypothetical protein [Candidatus Peribacteria bacterium]
MNNIVHTDLANGKWNELSLPEQLGNVGSEISRAFRAKRINNPKRMESAVYRALELMDLTKSDPKHKNRLREICRTREVVCDFFLGENEYSSTEEFLNKYFMDFALAARNQV